MSSAWVSTRARSASMRTTSSCCAGSSRPSPRPPAIITPRPRTGISGSNTANRHTRAQDDERVTLSYLCQRLRLVERASEVSRFERQSSKHLVQRHRHLLVAGDPRHLLEQQRSHLHTRESTVVNATKRDRGREVRTSKQGTYHREVVSTGALDRDLERPEHRTIDLDDPFCEREAQHDEVARDRLQADPELPALASTTLEHLLSRH
ncbi:hypothetical protein PybrP1_003867 [[Pythium] brassicae (nom. inval.)]|nr:hypothetical protein PybrP1_003867 [[Pythium] brassicae (nom. inval.)]